MAEKSHVSKKKKDFVKNLEGKLSHKTIMLVSIKNLPSAQFQDIKKKIRKNGKIILTKKSLLGLAMENTGNVGLKELEHHLGDGIALLFSDDDAFELSAMLADCKSKTKAKPGQEALENIEIKAGPTDLVPGPDISALSAVGLAPKVEGGKISVMKDTILVKKGEKISAPKAAVLSKLGVMPFEIGIEPVAAYMDGKVYENVKVDKKATIAYLENAYARALPFAADIGYVVEDTRDLVLARASLHEKVITRIVNGEPDPEPVAVATTQTQEVTKREEPKAEAAEGLASLFG